MIINLILLSVSVFLVSSLLPGIYIKNYGTAIVVAIVYSLVNFFMGWVLVILSFPFIILTLGLFTFVINAILLWITDKVVNDFEIKSFTSTLVAAFLISLTNALLHWIF